MGQGRGAETHPALPCSWAGGLAAGRAALEAGTPGPEYARLSSLTSGVGVSHEIHGKVTLPPGAMVTSSVKLGGQTLASRREGRKHRFCCFFFWREPEITAFHAHLAKQRERRLESFEERVIPCIEPQDDGL